MGIAHRFITPLDFREGFFATRVLLVFLARSVRGVSPGVGPMSRCAGFRDRVPMPPSTSMFPIVILSWRSLNSFRAFLWFPSILPGYGKRARSYSGAMWISARLAHDSIRGRSFPLSNLDRPDVDRHTLKMEMCDAHAAKRWRVSSSFTFSIRGD